MNVLLKLIVRENLWPLQIFFYVFVAERTLYFLFGALINLTVRVDAYFHLIRMTNPIHRTIFPGSTKLGKAHQTLTLPQNFSKRADILTVCSLQ